MATRPKQKASPTPKPLTVIKTTVKAKAGQGKTELPWARHVVCFWKQNDLGLFGRRPDRWIEYWRQHPEVEKVLVFEPPMSHAQLLEMLRLATTLDHVSASEYQLLLQQATQKLIGRCDDNKVRYCTFYQPEGQSANGPLYLNWVLQKVGEEGIEAPLLVLWPACYANEALIQKIQPSHILVDLIDDQRLFPGNEGQAASITDQYRTFMILGDQVVSNSTGLIQSFQNEFGQAITHWPNQLLPMTPHETGTQPLKVKKDPRRPVVGYVGNMRGRIDIETMMDAIQKHPEWDFWFVGQTHRSAYYQAVRSFANVYFWGTMDSVQARAVMKQFDVAVVPFVENSLVQTMSPIKVDDYAQMRCSTVVLSEKNKKLFLIEIEKIVNKRNL